jgi:hypothetical protein
MDPTPTPTPRLDAALTAAAFGTPFTPVNAQERMRNYAIKYGLARLYLAHKARGQFDYTFKLSHLDANTSAAVGFAVAWLAEIGAILDMSFAFDIAYAMLLDLKPAGFDAHMEEWLLDAQAIEEVLDRILP